MMNRIKSILNNSKKKKGIVVIGGALALTLCTGVVFAASPSDVKAKVGNGVTTYSTDEGKSFTKQAPDGLKEVINDGHTVKYSTGGGKIRTAGNNYVVHNLDGSVGVKGQ